MNPLKICEWWFKNLYRASTWRRQWHPTPVLLPGKSHGQRSLVGCSPWGREESDMTERLHFHFLLSRIGEGNGNPLQCSCPETPRDGGTWWAVVYGVAASFVSNSVRPHRQQPTRRPRPWDSPGESTGVGCHCLLRNKTWTSLKLHTPILLKHRLGKST